MSFVADRHLTNLALRLDPIVPCQARGTKHHVQHVRWNGALQTGRFCWLLRLFALGGVAAVARALASILAISRRAMAVAMTAFMIRLTWPGMMTGRQMRTCWQALYQSSPLRFSAQEKRARGRSRCGSACLE